MVQQLENSTEEKDSEYPSSRILFDLAKGEYDYEMNRKRDLETRSGILIVLIGAIIGLFINAIDISLINLGKTSIEKIFFIVITLSNLFPLILILLSLKELIGVLNTREYTRIDVSGVSNELAQLPESDLNNRLAQSYKNAVANNDLINTEKVTSFKKGIDYIYKAVIFFIIVYLVTLALQEFI